MVERPSSPAASRRARPGRRPVFGGPAARWLTGFSYPLQVGLFLSVGLALGTLIIWLVGENPLHVFKALLREAFFSPLGIMIAIQRATPYILASSAAVIAFQGGAINMGLDGQFLVGTVVAGIAAVALPEYLPSPVRIALVFGLCGVGGAAAAFVPAVFKRFSGVNEVITGMIANLLMPHLLRSVVFLFPVLRMAQGEASQGIPASTWLPQFAELPLGGWGSGTKANTAIFVAFVFAAGFSFLMKRTRLGYEIRVTRLSYTFAEFGGVRAGRMFFIAMMLSGAVAAMAGATEILGVWRKLSMGTLAVGYKGLVLALVGGNSFIGSAAVSLIYGGLEAGAMNASWSTEIPRPLIDVLVQMLFLTAAVPSMRRFFTGVDRSDHANLGGQFLTQRGR